MKMANNFQCQFCVKQFTHRGHFHRHLNRFHRYRDTIHKVKCPRCDFMTVDLEAHLALLHSTDFACVICDFQGKDFKELRNHESKAHAGDFLCLVCNEVFSDAGQMNRHMHDEMEDEMNLLDENILEIYEENIFAIKTHTIRGKTTDIYNIRWKAAPYNIPPDWQESLWTLFKEQETRFKINYSHCFILQNKTDGQYRYFHSSHSNHLAKEECCTVNSTDDMQNFIDDIESTDHLDMVQKERPDTGDSVSMIPATTFYVTPLDRFPIGNDLSLPVTFSKQRGLVTFHKRPGNQSRYYNDGLCFFRCLSYHFRKSTDYTEHLYHMWKGLPPDKNFRGVTMAELDAMEKIFNVPIDVYMYSDKELTLLRLLRRGYVPGENRMQLLKYNSHFVLILDIDSVCRAFSC